ncbi:MAG: hypothetical protein HY774_22620 [Acidobacteria bacterium]|nr:hypothetical protein [Acidobacteriota bacterium]
MWKPALRRTHRNAGREAFAPGRALDQSLKSYGKLRIPDRQDVPAPIRARSDVDRDPVVCPKRQTTGYFPAPIRAGVVKPRRPFRNEDQLFPPL